MASLKPPFNASTAQQKVKAAQALWNTQDPSRVPNGYTVDSVWRNRSFFIHGRKEIEAFLTQKWAREKEYRLRKELFCFESEGKANKIAVEFWYEYRDAEDGMKWKRCYGIEHWTFDADGKMEKRHMSGNDVEIGEEGRWFKDGVDVDAVELRDEDF